MQRVLNEENSVSLSFLRCLNHSTQKVNNAAYSYHPRRSDLTEMFISSSRLQNYIEVIHQARKTVFDRISKHREEGRN